MRDIKDSPTRIGRVVEGVGTNRGARNYEIVHIRMNFVDAYGAIVGRGSDFTQRLSSGDQWRFKINMTGGSILYKVIELRGQ